MNHNGVQLLALLSLMISVGISSTSLAQPTRSITHVTGDLYRGQNNNHFMLLLVTDDGIIMTDPINAGFSAWLKAEVASRFGVPVRYVLYSHHHGDHAGGNVEYINIAEIIAHQNARDNMVRGNQDAPPRVVFTDQTAVYLGGVEVRAFYMGTGHTNGDAVIYFPDLRTVHGGDLLHGTAPFIDYANGGSSAGWVATMNNVLALDFDTAIPGHGAIMDRSDVVAFRNQMEAVRARMADLIRAGTSKDQASERIRAQSLSWTMAENGLFMQRSIPGFYDEIAAGLP